MRKAGQDLRVVRCVLLTRMRRVSQTPKGMDDSHQTPKGVDSRGAQFLAEVAGRSLSALLVRSLSCAMSGGRVGDSSRETRGAIGACGDGASGGVLGF